MTLSAVILLLPGAVGQAVPSLPSPHDAHGWALRVRGTGLAGPYFRCESLTHPRFEIILINKSSETRQHPFLEDALKTGALSVELKQPDGKGVGRRVVPHPTPPNDAQGQLRPVESASRFFTLRQFGYSRVQEPGEYTAQIKFKTAQGTVLSPPWKFRVVDVPPEAVLFSHPIEGSTVNWEALHGPEFVQQVKVGSRVFLLKRHFAPPREGGFLASTQQVTELPGKVEMTVEGVHENEMPLIIRYRTSPTVTTTLTIDSVNGTVWNKSDSPARDGDLRSDAPASKSDGKMPPGKESSPAAPAPRLAKP
jgi:hypothetical protein